MKRYNLICLFLGAGLTWAGAADADHLGPLTSPEDAREEIYNQIMTTVSRDTLQRKEWSTPGGKSASFDYRSAEEFKTLTVCINWYASSHYMIDYNNFWYSSNHRLPSKSKRSAMFNCKRVLEKKYGCTCEVVDQDDENVLVVPEDFLARYAANTLPGDPPGTTQKGNRFEWAGGISEWAGVISGGGCSIFSIEMTIDNDGRIVGEATHHTSGTMWDVSGRVAKSNSINMRIRKIGSGSLTLAGHLTGSSLSIAQPYSRNCDPPRFGVLKRLLE